MSNASNVSSKYNLYLSFEKWLYLGILKNSNKNPIDYFITQSEANENIKKKILVEIWSWLDRRVPSEFTSSATDLALRKSISKTWGN